jgi:hypothetical protein
MANLLARSHRGQTIEPHTKSRSCLRLNKLSRQAPDSLLDTGGHLFEFTVWALDRPALWHVSLLAGPDLAFSIFCVILVDQFSLNPIPSAQ